MENLNNVQLFMALLDKLPNHIKDDEDIASILEELEIRLDAGGFFPSSLVMFTRFTEYESFKWWVFQLSEVEPNQDPSEARLMVRLSFSKYPYTIPMVKRLGATHVVNEQFNKYKKVKNLDGRSKKSMLKELFKIIEIYDQPN